MSISSSPSSIADTLATKLVPVRCSDADAFVLFERAEHRKKIAKAMLPTREAADKFASMNRRSRVSLLWHLTQEARHVACFSAFEPMLEGFVRMRFHQLLGLPLVYDPAQDVKPKKAPIDVSRL